MKKRLLLTVLLGVTLVLLAWSQTGVVKAQFSAYEYANAKSLTQAVELCKQKLVEDGHEEYAALISEQTVRAAIRSAIRSYESKLANSDEGAYNFYRSEEYFRNVVKPKYMQIAEEGRWPEGCYFRSVYRRSDPIRLVTTAKGEKIRIDLEQPGRLSEEMGGVRNQEIAALPCSYALPPEYPQYDDPSLVDFRFNDDSLPMVQSAASCDASLGGWYLDDPQAPRQIKTCPVTCDKLRQGGTVNTRLGCPPPVVL